MPYMMFGGPRKLDDLLLDSRVERFTTSHYEIFYCLHFDFFVIIHSILSVRV